MAKYGADFGISGVDCGTLVTGAAELAVAVVPGTGRDAGVLGWESCATGTAGTDAPGTRGNENTSLNPAK